MWKTVLTCTFIQTARALCLKLWHLPSLLTSFEKDHYISVSIVKSLQKVRLFCERLLYLKKWTVKKRVSSHFSEQNYYKPKYNCLPEKDKQSATTTFFFLFFFVFLWFRQYIFFNSLVFFYQTPVVTKYYLQKYLNFFFGNTITFKKRGWKWQIRKRF